MPPCFVLFCFVFFCFVSFRFVSFRFVLFCFVFRIAVSSSLRSIAYRVLSAHTIPNVQFTKGNLWKPDKSERFSNSSTISCNIVFVELGT